MKNFFITIQIFAYTVFCITNTLAQEFQLEHSVLWKIDHESLEKPSYLFGTVHLMCAEDFEMKEKVIKAFDSTRQLVLEINLSDPAEIMAVQNALMNGEKFSQNLTEEETEKLKAFIEKKLGMSWEEVENMPLSTVYSTILSESLPCENKKMFELELMMRAMGSQKGLGGLESATQQLEMLDKALSPAYFIEQLESFDEVQESFEKAIDSYKAENLDKTVAILMEEQFMDEETEDLMLNDRNKDWVTKIPGIIKENSSFIAVGAAHLVGEEGVIYLLREAGYSVTPVFE